MGRLGQVQAIYDIAADLCEMGLACIPADDEGAPTGERKLEDATGDLRDLADAFLTNPGPKIAVRLGSSSGIIAFQIDPSFKDGRGWLKALAPHLSDGPALCTDSGEILAFFEAPKGFRSGSFHLAPGCRVRGDGDLVSFGHEIVILGRESPDLFPDELLTSVETATLPTPSSSDKKLPMEYVVAIALAEVSK